MFLFILKNIKGKIYTSMLPQKHMFSHTQTHIVIKDIHEFVKPLLLPEAVACIFISGDILQCL